MVKKVFVFSDMEFDQASSRPWETDYEALTRKYSEARRWRFSKNMLKIFLGGEEEAIPDIPCEEEAIPNIPTPRDVMEKAISGPEYEKLVVFD
ncbi:hypothetical protein QYE76_037126 [Lolium multiflorum]|uniref:DUF7788 domain-containing protein n=1 Tax=Lolium multiflorum TaxID=4521 RepID=A0AAD8R684_LOLMU|nr:hypothetical protein QYE76_037126 [Lolium multiflorum]